MMTYSKILMTGVAATALMAGQAWAQSTPRVGVVSAVNPAAVGTPPGADTRPIVIGSDVAFREKVVTTGDGQAQLMFLDQSTMMIGPNSQVVIDEFVFDPNTSSGKFAATLTQGSFRYIGGKLSKQGDATLKTPVATIGIRGSDIIVGHNDGSNTSDIKTIHGNATVQSNGQTIKLPTGFGTLVNGPGQAPNYPQALSAAIINAAKVMFEGQPGKTAGAQQVPQNENVEKSGLSNTVQAAGLSGIAPGAGGAGGGGGALPPPPQFPAPNPYINPLQNAENGGTTPTASNTPNTPPVNPGPNPGTNPGNPGGQIQSASMVGYVGGGAYRGGAGAAYNPYLITNDNPSDVQINTHAPEAGATFGTVDASITFRSRLQIAIPSANVQMGDTSGSAGNSALFSNNQFVATNPSGTVTLNNAPVQASIVLVTDNQALGGLSQIVQNLQNVEFCTCEFMSWGFMLGSLTQPGGSLPTDVILGTFVTGVLPDISARPSATASFSGHVIGVSSTSGGYTAGSFTLNNYSFDSGSGNFAITNFDGNNMNGTVNARTNDWRSYSGSLAPTAGQPAGRATSGTANGSFFVAPGTPAGAVPLGTGGNIMLNGPGYNASGTFVGQNTNIVGGVTKNAILKK